MALTARLLNPLPPQTRLCQLLNVVHHAVQIPLRVDLGVAPVVQPRQTLVVADVGKHRLHRAKALAVKLSSPGRVNRLAHALTGVARVFGFGLKAGDLSAPCGVGFHRVLDALTSERAGIAIHRFGGVHLIVQTSC